MRCLVALRELEEQINWQNEQEEDHKRYGRHDCSFNPRTSVIDLVGLIRFLLRFLGAEEPLVSLVSKKLYPACSYELHTSIKLQLNLLSVVSMVASSQACSLPGRSEMRSSLQ